MIVAEADEMGGFSLWVDENGLLHHSYSMMGVERYEQVSTEPIPTGDVTVRMQFDADRQERSAGGTVYLYANDEQIGEGRIERTVAVRFSGYAGMDVGRDNGLPVDRAYAAKSPYPFTGTVKKVVYDLKPGTHEDEKCAARGGRARRCGSRDQRLGGGVTDRRYVKGELDEPKSPPDRLPDQGTRQRQSARRRVATVDAGLRDERRTTSGPCISPGS